MFPRFRFLLPGLLAGVVRPQPMAEMIVKWVRQVCLKHMRVTSRCGQRREAVYVQSGGLENA